MDWPYSEKFKKEFFSLYSTLPTLWDPSSPDYRKNRSRLRDAEATILLDKFKEVEPEATKSSLLKKMGILRSQYKIEMKRSQENGRPMRKFFKFLSFLQDVETQKTPRNIKSENPKTVMIKSKDPLDIDPTFENETVSPAEYLECVNNEEEEEEEGVALDRFDHCTRAWILSLQSVSRDQQIVAERIINNVLFEAQVGNLTTQCPYEVSKILNRNW